MSSFENEPPLALGALIKEKREKEAQIADRVFLLKSFSESLGGLIKQGGDFQKLNLEQILDCVDVDSRERLAIPENKRERQELIDLVAEQINSLIKALEQIESAMATAWQQFDKNVKDIKIGDEKPEGVVELEEKQIFFIGVQKTLQALSNELTRWGI